MKIKTIYVSILLGMITINPLVSCKKKNNEPTSPPPIGVLPQQYLIIDDGVNPIDTLTGESGIRYEVGGYKYFMFTANKYGSEFAQIHLKLPNDSINLSTFPKQEYGILLESSDGISPFGNNGDLGFRKTISYGVYHYSNPLQEGQDGINRYNKITAITYLRTDFDVDQTPHPVFQVEGEYFLFATNRNYTGRYRIEVKSY